VMIRIWSGVGPATVGLNSTVTVSVFFLPSVNMPMSGTEKGGLSVSPIMT
jgi:hypothetical protein